MVEVLVGPAQEQLIGQFSVLLFDGASVDESTTTLTGSG
jgi:hypothetical protein